MYKSQRFWPESLRCWSKSQRVSKFKDLGIILEVLSRSKSVRFLRDFVWNLLDFGRNLRAFGRHIKDFGPNIEVFGPGIGPNLIYNIIFGWSLEAFGRNLEHSGTNLKDVGRNL